MTAFEIEAIKAALQKMWDGGHFSICTIDQILTVTKGIPNRADYDALRLLHCVNFRDMTPALRLALPRKIQLVVESAPMPLLKSVALDLAEGDLGNGKEMLRA